MIKHRESREPNPFQIGVMLFARFGCRITADGRTLSGIERDISAVVWQKITIRITLGETYVSSIHVPFSEAKHTNRRKVHHAYFDADASMSVWVCGYLNRRVAEAY